MRAGAAEPLGGAARHEPRGLAAAGLLRRLGAHPDQPAGSAGEHAQRDQRERLRAAARTPGSCRPTPRATERASCPSQPFDPGETVTVRGRVKTSAGDAGRSPTTSSSPSQDTLPYTPARQGGTRPQRGAALPLRPHPAAAGARGDGAARRRPRPGTSSPPPTRGRAQRAEDLQRNRQTGVVRPAAGRSGGDQPAGAAVRRQAGADLVAGLHPPAGLRRGRRDDLLTAPTSRSGACTPATATRPTCTTSTSRPQGTALLTVFDPIDCNLSAVGGPSGGAVTDSVFQEIDLRTGLVRREWHSLDHVPLERLLQLGDEHQHRMAVRLLPHQLDRPARRRQDADLRPQHLGAVRTEHDHRPGAGCASAASTRTSSSLNGAATAFQHDATVQANGTISVFDNGAVPKVHPQSRGDRAVGRPAGQDRHGARPLRALPSALSSGSQGNVQTLRQRRRVRRLGRGALLLGIQLQPGSCSTTRTCTAPTSPTAAYRFPWTGTPASAPAIAASAASPQRAR